MSGKIIGIDASRNRSGGARAHLIGILVFAELQNYGIKEVHLWVYQSLADSIPNYPWLVKHVPKVTEKSIFHQLWWQYYSLPKQARALGCDLLFNTDAGSVCSFSPSITLSQDMLSFEFGEMSRYGFSKSKLRLVLLKYVQLRSLKNAEVAVFLTNYAKNVILKNIRNFEGCAVIPHGIGDEFRNLVHTQSEEFTNKEIRCIYVSNVAMYKHQWMVVRAIKQLRDRGYEASLLLVGGGAGRAKKLLDRQILMSDPDRQFVKQISFVPHASIPSYLAQSDIFVFASSCENMPITLLEGMASGLPIVCSNRGPMPEILQNGGLYFDPENPTSIANALEILIQSPELRKNLASLAQEISKQYTWERCARETWSLFMSSLGKGGC